MKRTGSLFIAITLLLIPATLSRGATTRRPNVLFFAADDLRMMGYSLREDRYRYTEWRDWKSGGLVGVELYDHETDDAETANRAGEIRLTEVRHRLAAQLARQFPVRALPLR